MHIFTLSLINPGKKILTVNTSIPLYIHGSSDVHFYDLRDTHKCCVYTNISVASLGVYIIVVRLLAAGPRGRRCW